jgi:hypothetical protein
MYDNINPDEQRIGNDFGGTATEAGMEQSEPVSVQFKPGDGPEFSKPDHDPHGETVAAVSHSMASCDGGCGMSGLVPTALLEDANGLTGWPPFDILCEACAEVRERDDYSF